MIFTTLQSMSFYEHSTTLGFKNNKLMFEFQQKLLLQLQFQLQGKSKYSKVHFSVKRL